MQFEFVHFQAQLHAREPDLVSRVRMAVDPADDRLQLNEVASGPGTLVLQTPRGSTRGQVTAELLTLRTDYHGAFRAEDAHAQRFEYASSKLDALLEWTERATVRTNMLGVIFVARHAVPAELRAARLDELARAFRLDALGGPAPKYDFVVKASSVVDNLFFANVQVSWYQTRSVNIGGPAIPGRPVPLVYADWEMQLAEEGIEIRFDWNNKFGLIAGKAAWSAQEHAALLVRMADEVPQALASVKAALAEEQGGN